MGSCELGHLLAVEELRRFSQSTITNVIPIERSAISSPVHTNDRLSPRENGSAIHQPHPSPSSGSESSGYFTPPPETQQAFVKLDTEDHVSESGNDNNNNSQDCTDNPTQGNFSPSFLDASEAKEQGLNNNPEREERRLLRFSSSSLKEPSFTGKLPPSTEDRRKSKSVVDLQSFLPDITVKRKTVNSAPPLNDDSPSSNNNNIEDLPISPAKTMLPSSESLQKLESPSEEVCERKLTKRFARTLSRKSIKSTPRSLRDTTPRSSRPSSKPKELLQLALAQLNSNEWEVMVQGLQALGKLTRQHPDAIESQIHTVCVTLARQIKNLRSQVARTACHTASELFLNCKRGLDIELEEIAGPLLQRTADTNKFLRADANAALDVMCVQLPTNRVITVVTTRGCTHPNCVVRSTSIRLINDMVKRFGADRIFQMQKDIRDKILVAGANALTDGSLDARSYGKAMFSYLIGHQQFQKSLLDAVSQSTLRHIAKTLSSIKPQVTSESYRLQADKNHIELKNVQLTTPGYRH
ncbi:hypothetical protein NQ315_007774 [Exocentrus adspersus]|uniref:TOG domain-containing protein n=1 Tax=Exocentrus adspersus TaxID=1586481 RepID=A0AAV8W8M5_9CUCU|nr:hypothetical protein NQ315_007774 [Exocentrus adspersus]